MIKSIIIDNFRCVEHADMQLSPRVNLVTGPNRAGKSTVGAAIEFAYTGRCSFVDDAGTGLDGLIHRGAKKATVGFTLSNEEGQ